MTWPATLNGRRVAILAADGVERVELEQPRQALEDAGARTEVVSITSGEIQARNNDLEDAGTFAVDQLVGAVSVDDYEALLLPGGTVNPDKLRMEPAAVQFVRDFVQSGKPVASICHGPWNFVEADVARGRRLTSWPSVRTDLRNAGAEVVDEQVVTDGNITTSRSPDDLPAFCERIVQEFAGRPSPPAREVGHDAPRSATWRPSPPARAAAVVRQVRSAIDQSAAPAGCGGAAGVRVAGGDHLPRADRDRPTAAAGTAGRVRRPDRGRGPPGARAARAPSWPRGCAPAAPRGTARSARLTRQRPAGRPAVRAAPGQAAHRGGRGARGGPRPARQADGTPGGALLEAWTKVAPKGGVL